jgi:tol-pal system protein YbgF
MTRFSTPLCFVVCALICSTLAVSGCGPSKASLKKTIDNLEKQVAQLKTERVNLEARSGALDDRAVVLQTKLNHCRQDTMPLLKVIKLSRGDQEEEPSREPDDETAESSPVGISAPIKDDATRPKLVLQGGGNQGIPPAAVSGPSAVGGYFGLDADSLGVVKQGDPGTDQTAEAFQSAYLAYSNRKYSEALASFSKLIQTDPQHQYADNAVFWRGECYLALGDFFKAIGEFERLLRRYPSSEMSPSSLYRIGFAYDQLSDRSKAVEYYFKVVDRYPESDAARRASRRVSAIESDGGRASSLAPTAVKR